MEDLMLSSPDPLNDSPTFYSPKKTYRVTKARQSLPRSGSPTKQRFELDVGGNQSPQKLIVTVEAESQSGNRPSSPSRRPVKVRERTTTTTIPVKGLSDSEGETEAATTPKKGRGRPRRSQGTPIQTKKGRAGTPTRRSSSKRRSFGDLVDGDDEDDVNFQIGKNVDMGRRRGKSRSRSAKGVSRRSLSVSAEAEDTLEESTISRSSRRPRQASVADQIEVQEDLNTASPIHDTASGTRMPYRSNQMTQISHEDTTTSPTQPLEEDSIAMVPAPSSPARTGPVSSAPSPEDQEVVSEEEDEVGELREFDTILESEEFSMISVDSVPSLRQHFSSPIVQDDAPAASSISKSKKLDEEAARYNDSFSAISERVLVAATPARAHISRPTFQVAGRGNEARETENLKDGNDYRSLGGKSHLSKFQSANSMIDDSFSSIAPEILEAATPGRPRSKPHSNVLERSLASKHPSPVTSAMPPINQQSSTLNGRADIGRRSVSATQSTTTRLPTPDETPSPGDDGVYNLDATGKFRQDDPLALHEDFDVMQKSYLKSSPPHATHQRSNMAQSWRLAQLQHPTAQTPSIVFSSPSLPPPINHQREPIAFKSTLEYSARPPLSPVARVGQALQNITVPSSPRLRSNSLGSPFKSPVAERRYLPSPTEEPRQTSLTYTNFENSSGAQQRQSGRSDLHQDDPFRNDEPTQQRSPSPESNSGPYKLGIPAKPKIQDSRIAQIKSADVSMASDDAMSWQAEEEISVTENAKFVAKPDASDVLERKWASERAAVSQQIAEADPEQVVVIASDSEELEGEEDEDDIGLLVETINSSSPVASTTHFSEAVEKPRRSKIPSPWRKTSNRLQYHDESIHISSPIHFSTNVKSMRTSETGTKNVTLKSKPPTRRKEQVLGASDELDTVDISNIQIPQKSNFQPRPKTSGKLDLSALLSPIKPIPIMPKEAKLAQIQVPNQQQQPTQASSEEDEDVSEAGDAFPPIPQKAGFNPTPRKTAGTQLLPVHGLFNRVTGSRQLTPSAEESSTTASQERSPLVSKQPLAINRQKAPEVQEPYSPVSTDDPGLVSPAAQIDKENTPAHQDARTLKWTQSLHLATKIVQTPLPDRNASPTKSCFRTPAGNVNQSPSKNVVFVSSSPVPSASEEVILSPTQWSKSHWLLLEEIMAVHKAEHERETSPGGDESKPRRRRNSTRVISKLLGRKITAGDDEMRLEQWHLEAVDEFRGRVPGWEEKVIAMRLFALIVGAEQRRLGIVR